jgi:DNA-binding transcriptional LysR family regulator
MDVVKFRAFHTVATLKSVSKAAEQLYYTQPAVSAQVRELENLYGARLFRRGGQHLELTEAGARLLPYAERLLAMFDESRQVVQEAVETHNRMIRIGASSVPGIHLVPELISDFRRSGIRCTFSVVISGSTRIEKMLASNEVDVAILGRATKPKRRSRFTEVLLIKDPLVVAVSNEHQFADRSSIHLADLSELPLILPARDLLTRKAVEDRLRALGLVFNLAFEISNPEAIKRMVMNNLGVSILCASIVQAEAASGWLKAVPVSGLNLNRRIWLSYPQGETIPPVLQSFLDFVVLRFRSEETVE